MTPSLLLLQLAIIFLPGVIWAHLDAKFASRSAPSQIEFVARSFVFGLTSYAVTFVIYIASGWPFELGQLERIESNVILTPEIAWQILIATAVGFVSSVVWMYGVRFKWLTRLLQNIGATRTYGDEDVWEYTLNSNSAVTEYVHVRDFAQELVYGGWLMTFSSSGKLREMVLRDVVVYDFNGEVAYETPRLYLSRASEGLHIEFPATEAEIDATANAKETV